MYELEMYMLLEHICLQNKILVHSFSHILQNIFDLTYLIYLIGYCTMIVADWQKLGIVLATSNVLGIS